MEMEKSMNGELLLTALERIEREKGISKDVLFSAIESALASAARKVIDDPDVAKEDITVTINKETGEIEIFSEGVEVRSEQFGRIAAQTAKQVMIQKIREAERDVIHDKYDKKVGMIISGSVRRFEKGDVIVELDDTEAVLPKAEQLPKERFRQGEQLRAYLLKVDKSASGPEIILSRTDAGFVKKLFELEVPEISQGIVEIKGIAREAGERTKIAVYSKDEKVDPVGACVGMRGSRVRDIVKELHGERIDIVRWSDDIRDYIVAAVSPAEVSKMIIDRENETVTLIVAQDQLSLLIGKKGRNIRLASKLLGWELVAESSEKISLSEIPGVGKTTQKVLEEAGYTTARKIVEAGIEKLSELKGVGVKTAEKILAACKEVIKDAAPPEEKIQKEEEPEEVKEEPLEEPEKEEEPSEETEEPEKEEKLPEEDTKEPEKEEELPEENTEEPEKEEKLPEEDTEEPENAAQEKQEEEETEPEKE